MSREAGTRAAKRRGQGHIPPRLPGDAEPTGSTEHPPGRRRDGAAFSWPLPSLSSEALGQEALEWCKKKKKKWGVWPKSTGWGVEGRASKSYSEPKFPAGSHNRSTGGSQPAPPPCQAGALMNSVGYVPAPSSLMRWESHAAQVGKPELRGQSPAPGSRLTSGRVAGGWHPLAVEGPINRKDLCLRSGASGG